MRSTEIRVMSERLDPHGVAGRDVAPVFLEHDEAIARGHRGEDAGALWSRGARLPAAVRATARMPRLNSRRPFRLLIGSTAIASTVSGNRRRRPASL